MEIALDEAKKAFVLGEVPVGAVIVKGGKVVSKAHNERETKQNALCHAELLAIDKACKKLKSFRLDGCEMFVTLEPCVMCSGAIVASRLDRLTYGAGDEKFGGAGGYLNILGDKNFEHNVEIIPFEMEKECKQLLAEFFVKIRQKNKTKKILGNNIVQKTFCFDFENGALCEMNEGIVVALVENTATMEILPVCARIDEPKLPAEEIFEKLKKCENVRDRLKIETKWGEKKYFN